jgi:primosomal protein N' (replication factor Y)
MQAHGLAEIVEVQAETPEDEVGPVTDGPTLTSSQEAAVEAILTAAGAARPVLLFGVTGSGKTEVYLRAIESVLAAGRQAMVLVPEIGLTPQTVRRFRRRFGCPIAVLHSGLSEKTRLESWADARSGRARILIGTRSAVFTPMADCGLIAVDEEHDPSFKQQEGFRYCARDVAVVRAHRAGIPIVLGSATPSLESMRNAETGRYRRVDLAERPGASVSPRVRVVDLRVTPSRDGLTTPLLETMQRHLAGDGQVILFLNRRGYATALFCTECGWVAECPRCDARMTLHRHPASLRCHHCGRSEAPPPTCGQCGAGLRPVGQGTERIESTLASLFPQVVTGRLDRDTARSREALAALLNDMQHGRIRILIGTQMLTKGHDFPGVTLVGVLNCDQGLFGTDFRSDERLAQTILQVSGRAGRRRQQGEVLLQTSYPQHPLLGHLVRGGYAEFAREALDERAAAAWPPYTHLALLRAEATRRQSPTEFLQRCRALAEAGSSPDVSVLGPAPAPMEKRSGRYRAQLLFRSAARPPLHAMLDGLLTSIESMKESRQVRWSLDVDPVELF